MMAETITLIAKRMIKDYASDITERLVVETFVAGGQPAPLVDGGGRPPQVRVMLLFQFQDFVQGIFTSTVGGKQDCEAD